MHQYKLDDEVWHHCDSAPFIVVGIRKEEVEIKGDWSGGTNHCNLPDWVKPEDIKPYDRSKVQYYEIGTGKPIPKGTITNENYKAA